MAQPVAPSINGSGAAFAARCSRSVPPAHADTTWRLPNATITPKVFPTTTAAPMYTSSPPAAHRSRRSPMSAGQGEGTQRTVHDSLSPVALLSTQDSLEFLLNRDASFRQNIEKFAIARRVE